MGSDKEMVMSGVVSRVRRGLLWGLAAGVVLLMMGDHAMTASAANSGIDPYEILDLQIRPNAIIVLDSSGSMREESTGTYGLSGDDPNSKLAVAKRVLKSVVSNNKDKISFQFGQYENTNPTTDPYSPRITVNDRFLYATDDATIANWEVNRASNAAAQGGISRLKGLTGDDALVGTKTYYYVRTGKLFNGETIDISACTGGGSGTACTSPAPTITAATTVGAVPPATLWADASGSLQTQTRPYLILKKGTTSVNLYFAGTTWSSGTGACQGFKSLVPLASCTADGNTQVTNINPYLAPEVFYGTDGSILGYADSTLGSAPTSQPAIVNGTTPVGLRAESRTPIAGSLDDIRLNFWVGGLNYWTNRIQTQTLGRRQRTFIIFVTDGDDTCAGTGSGDGDARAAARAAEALFKPAGVGNTGVNGDGSLKSATDPSSSITTFFISFGAGADLTRSNWIAWGGSGLGEGWTSSPTSINWTSSSNTTLQNARNACLTCQDALTASTASELEAALQAAIDKGSSIGEFSSQSQGSVTDTVFEFVGKVGLDPLNGAAGSANRYNSSFDLTVRSTFLMPNFEGQLKAYDSTGAVVWDAGQVLKTNVLNVVGAGPWSFAELHGGSSVAPTFIPAATAKIRRRIFTTSRNGTGPMGNVPLWPPTTDDAGVAPNNTTTYPAGSLDGSASGGTGLGIGGLTFAQLKAQFLACDGSVPADIHADCGSTTASVQLGRAMKEAREIILAFTAGAKLSLAGGKPLRNSTTKDLQYNARTWLLAESTIATPAFVGQPGETNPVLHPDEWILYKDGPRDVSNHLAGSNSIENGFGLRNPDRLDPNPSTGGEQEPVMTVLYVPANDMLHAFRAGPQSCSTSTACPPAGKEAGGEELWGYVSYDLLPKLKDKRNPQSRVTPTYMFSSSLRFGDVFVPGSFTGPDSKTYAGKWRTLMFLGRGPGGKFITGLDITGPGPFTRNALETRLPDVLWNRGNGDTADTDYATMGETWSIPALVPVNPATDDTSGKEWVLWMGSGFSDVSGEGRNFYTIDVTNGDILRTVDVGVASGSGLRTNFLNAGVAGFVPTKLVTGNQAPPNAADGPATAAFVGDLHGRLFRFSSNALTTATILKDLGPDQPIGVAVAALNLEDGTVKKPFVFGVTGADNRIFNPKGVPLVATPPFVMFGIRDDGSGITNLFDSVGTTGTIPFPERFRGSTQPLVAAVDSANVNSNVVFFIGTQFNPAGTSTTSTEPCISSFDSILFAVNASSGNAAYDLQTGAADDRSAVWRGQKVQNITSRNDKVVLDTGLNAGGAPPPPPPPTPQNSSQGASVFTNAVRYGSPVCKW